MNKKSIFASLSLFLFSLSLFSAPPSFIDIPSRVEIAENSDFIIAIQAEDPDGKSVKYSLRNTFRDSSQFFIGDVSGQLYFVSSKDYENPTDADENNIYLLMVQATDSDNERSTAVIRVVITNYDDEFPIIDAKQQHYVNENHLYVNQFQATDIDSDNLTWSLSSSFRQNAYFNINSSTGKLYFNSIPDFENPASGTNKNKVRISVSDGTNTTSKVIVVNVRDAKENQLSFSLMPTTHIVLDGSTPQNLMYDFESSSVIGNYSGEPISYETKRLNQDLSFGSYPYTLVAGFVGYWEDTVDTSGYTMSNAYDDYLIDTSDADDRLYIRLEQPQFNPDCGTNDFNDNQPLCSISLEIYKYDEDFDTFAIYRSIVNTWRNKTIKLPPGNNSYLIRVAASAEMTSNQGNSQYYLYAYRAGNTPGNVLNAFSMANNGASNSSYSWYQPDVDTLQDEKTEFAANRILVYKKNNRVRNQFVKKRSEYKEIQALADEVLLLKDGYSVVELDERSLEAFAKPSNKVISNQGAMINADSVNGDQPLSRYIRDIESPSNDIKNIVSALSKLYPDNEFSLDYKVYAHDFQYDPDYIRYQKEYFDMVNAEEGLNAIGTADAVRDVVIGVIDSGSPSKSSRAWNSSNWVDGEYDFVSSDFDATDPSATMEYPSNGSHGTHVATTIAAKNNSKNINGFGLKVLPLRALDENGSGYYSWICDAIAYAGQVENDTGQISPRKVDVINMSLGGGSSCPCQSVINDVFNAGVVIVASAGNGYIDENNYPASCDNVLSVSSLGSTGQKAYYSSFGEKVDISAPGGDRYLDIDGDGDWDGIWAFTKDNKLELYQGTSMAAPIASAAIGNVIAKFPGASPLHIDRLIKKRLILKDKGDPGFDRTYGYGMVDFEKISQNSRAPHREISTVAVVNTAILNLSTKSNGSIWITKSGPGNNINVTDYFSSHPGISISPSSNVNNLGFGKYNVVIDSSKFNGNKGRFQESISFEVTDNYVTDVISRPVIFQIANLSDARDPADLARMYFLAEISSEINADELDQNIFSEIHRVEGNTDLTHSIESAYYNYIISTDSDNDYYLCDFGEICWSELININANTDKDVIIDGNKPISVSSVDSFSIKSEGVRRDK